MLPNTSSNNLGKEGSRPGVLNILYVFPILRVVTSASEINNPRKSSSVYENIIRIQICMGETDAVMARVVAWVSKALLRDYKVVQFGLRVKRATETARKAVVKHWATTCIA